MPPFFLVQIRYLCISTTWFTSWFFDLIQLMLYSSDAPFPPKQEHLQTA